MPRRMTPTFILLLLTITFLSAVRFNPTKTYAAPAPCPGAGTTIAVNTTWSADCTLSGDTTVAVTATLTIAAGVDVLMTRSNARLFVNGRLNAQGTAANRISFTSGNTTVARGDWGQIVFNATSANSVLDFVTLQYGGAGRFPSVEIRSSSVRISNTMVRDNADDGIRIIDASPTLSNVTFANNGDDALDLQDASFPELSNLSASGNAFDGVRMSRGSPLNPPISIASNYTWGAGIKNYVVDGSTNVRIDAGATLTIVPGTVIRMGNGNSRLIVNGTLSAVGTAAQPIRFTSGKAIPAPGDWGRIAFGPTSTDNLLDYVIAEYGGAGIDAENPMIDIRTSSLTMRNSTVQRSDEDGIAVRDSSPTISNTTFSGNGPSRFGWAIDLYGASFPTLSGLTARDNGFDGVAINGVRVDRNYTWDGGGLGRYLLTDSVTVIPTATLTITPGLTIFLDNTNTNIVTQGTLRAQGTASAPIRFASGDEFTPGDTTANSGDWGSLVFEPGSADNLLEYVTVEQGGGISSGVVIKTNGVTIRNSTIARNRNGGIRVEAARRRSRRTILSRMSAAASSDCSTAAEKPCKPPATGGAQPPARGTRATPAAPASRSTTMSSSRPG